MNMSAEERGLLEAIAAAPKDATPCLVYADWLDENGDPVRAEFIRLSVRLERLDFDERSEGPGAELERQVEELKRQHAEKWTGLSARAVAVRGTEVLYRHGFPYEVWCSLKWFAENAAPLLELLPIPGFLLERVTPSNVHRLSTVAYFEKVRDLCFRRGHMTDEVMANLLATVPLAHIRQFQVHQSGIDSTTSSWHDRFAEQACRIARAPDFAELEVLDLRACGIGDRGGVAIADSRYLRGLKRLELRWNPMSPPVTARLRERFGDRVLL